MTEFTINPSYCTADYTLTAISQDGSTSSIPLSDLSLDANGNLSLDISGSDYGNPYTPGTYTVTVTGTINNADGGVTAPSTTDTFTFVVEDPCDAPDALTGSSVADQSYTITDTAVTIDLTTLYTITPSYCPVTIDVTINGNADGTQAVSETDGVITIFWDSSNAPVGNPVSVDITFTSDSDYYPSGTPSET